MKALQFNVNSLKFVITRSLKLFFGDKIFYKGPLKTIKIVEIPEPSLPSNQWVKIETAYCGFCGSDLNMIRLNESPSASPFTSFPCVVGHEVVGKVIEKGSEVKDFELGDFVAINPNLGCEARSISPVCPSCKAGRSGNCESVAEGDLPPGLFVGINSKINGGFAPVLVAHVSQLFKIPDNLALETAAMTEPLAIALQAIFDNAPEPGENALVIGAGVIGNLIVQSMRVLFPESKISVIEPSFFASKLAMASGADNLLSWDSVFEQSTALTGATVYKPLIGNKILMGGFNRIYDTIANSDTLNSSLRLLAAFGTLSVVGIGKKVAIDLTPLWLKLQNIQGVYSSGVVEYKNQKRHVFDIALELMASGRIDAKSLITHKFNLNDYQNMLEVNMNKGKFQAVKTLVSFVEP